MRSRVLPAHPTRLARRGHILSRLLRFSRLYHGGTHLPLLFTTATLVLSQGDATGITLLTFCEFLVRIGFRIGWYRDRCFWYVTYAVSYAQRRLS